ncbi:hypothetical protein QBC45DRAFT_424228 [Copromyces sp. CBS 386.78]|nr:hypothetical protein QBC45DRAFT_424228 [Copromyces sp. CBS 386.78]
METLTDAGSRTVALFEKIKALNQTSEHTGGDKWPATELATEADRFKLWAVNLGLFVQGHASLDYRVRDAESIRFVILRFIASLNDALTPVLEYVNGASTTSPEGGLEDSINATDESDGLDESFASQDGSDMDLLVEGVRDPIDRLFKLAVWIRNPSSRITSPKVLRYRLLDPETGVDLLDVFKEFDYDYVSSLFLEFRKSKARADHPITEPSSDYPDDNQSEQIWEPI